MGTFGLLFYGPFQHWWYGLLNQQWPLKVVSHFATKVRQIVLCSYVKMAVLAHATFCACSMQVALNQLVLGPIVTTVVFTWNLLLQQQSQEIPGKLKRDLVPTMINGKIRSFQDVLSCQQALSFCCTHCHCHAEIVRDLQAGSFGYQHPPSTSCSCHYNHRSCICLYVVYCGQHTFLIPQTSSPSW